MIKNKLKLKTEYRRKMQYRRKSEYRKKIQYSKKSKKYNKHQKTMNGGALGYGVPTYYISAFEKGDNKVAGYFYHIDKSDGYKTYFGIVRKCPPNGRIHYKYGHLTGAAGTKPEYHGKWTSIGGSRDPLKTHLQAIIDELNHEGNAGRRFDSRNVDMSNISRAPGKTPFSAPSHPDRNTIVCHMVRLQDSQTSPVIFLFEIPNPRTFFDIFPKAGFTSRDILRSSGGEIDAVKSFTFDEIISFQDTEMAMYRNNYFISYSMHNFRNIILPQIEITETQKGMRLDWISAFQRKIVMLAGISVSRDVDARTPSELTHLPYTTI